LSGQFGTSLAVVDMNGDGVDDLAVSAPSSNASSLTYKGAVFIFAGSIDDGLSNEPYWTVTGVETYSNIGTSLSSGDLDGDGLADLIVASKYAPSGGQQRGAVWLFLSSDFNLHDSLTTEQASVELKGESDYSWFGSQVSVFSTTRTAGKLLMIGASQFKNSATNQNSVGKIYGYTLSGKRPQLVFSVTGSEAVGKLGIDFDIGKPLGPNGQDYLALSLPTRNITDGKFAGIQVRWEQGGAVLLVPVNQLQDGNQFISDLLNSNSVITLEGDRSFGKFGWRIGFGDVNGDGNDDLHVAAPYRTDDASELLLGAQQGRVFVFYGGSSFPHDAFPTRHCSFASTVPCPGSVASLTLLSGEDKSRFGSEVSSPVPGKKVWGSKYPLLVSSSHSSLTTRLGGAVHLYY